MPKPTQPTSTVSALKQLDRLNADTPPPSLLGSFFTILLGLWLIGFFSQLVKDFLAQPPLRSLEILWTSMTGPIPGPLFPITLKPSLTETCTVSMHYSGLSSTSSTCAAAMTVAGYPPDECITLDPASDEPLTVNWCYSDLPSDGVFISCEGVASSGLTGLSVNSETDMPYMAISTPVHTGRTQLQLVQTLNETYSSNHVAYDRIEWFPVLLSSTLDGIAAPECLPGGGNDALLTLHAQWTYQHIVPHSLLDLYSSLGGAYALSFEIATAGFAISLFGKRMLKRWRTSREAATSNPSRNELNSSL